MENRNTYGGKFCSPDERQVTTIGTGYLASFLSGGGAERAGATLTNKRIYFSGKVFSLSDKGTLQSIKQQKIVNVRDVVGVGYMKHNPIQYIVRSVISLILGILMYEVSPLGAGGLVIGMLVSAVMIALFFLYRKTLLSIEYAGGNIAFDSRWIQLNEADTFIRNVLLTKDKLYSMAAIEQGFVIDGSKAGADDKPDL